MSEIRVTEASNEAIEHVLNHLWARGEEELQILDVSKPRAAQFVIEKRDEGAPNFAIWADEEPLCIVGLEWASNRPGPRGMTTWFQATHRFPLFYREITKRLRGGIEEEAGKYGLAFVEIFSPCLHEKTGRWFATLGFSFDVDYHHFTKAGVRVYRFVRQFGGGGVLQ